MNRLKEILQIEFPIIQAGMVWVSGWKLASAVSNFGGLGLIGSGSMKPDLLEEHIQKCRQATSKPFGVNLPLLRGDAGDLAKVIVNKDIKIVFTSAGHPGKFIELFKKNNIKVIHVVPSLKFAKKAESVGCDAVVCEGVEAGGHNGLDELTTFSLVPQLVDQLKIPVIAAGGIIDGRGIAAAMALGADGVQIGTRFAVTVESSAHQLYKEAVIKAKDIDTHLILKKLGMARVVKNKFSEEMNKMELNCVDLETQKMFLKSKREMKGIFEGDLEGGMLEASQNSGSINDIPTVKILMERLITEFENSINSIKL